MLLKRCWLPAAGATIGGLVAYAVLGLVAPAAVVAVLCWSMVQGGGALHRARRRARLQVSLLTMVDLLAQMLPAGHGARQALAVLAESGPPDLRTELRVAVARLDHMSLENSLRMTERSLGEPIFTLVAATLIVGSRSGGRLSPLLKELSRAAHQIESVQGQLRAEQAHGRLGALVIGAMPFVLLAALRVVNPQYLAPYGSAGGQLVLAAALTVILVGYLWMLRILRLPEPDVLPIARDGDRPRPRHGALARSRGYGTGYEDKTANGSTAGTPVTVARRESG